MTTQYFAFTIYVDAVHRVLVLTSYTLSCQIDMLRLTAANLTLDDLLNVTIRLMEITDPQIDKIYAGDILGAVQVLDFVVGHCNRTLSNVTAVELQNFFRVSGPFFFLMWIWLLRCCHMVVVTTRELLRCCFPFTSAQNHPPNPWTVQHCYAIYNPAVASLRGYCYCY